MNNNISERLAALGITVPELLLPRQGIDLTKWAVIACDQHTQDHSYWEQASAIAEGSPSALNLIFPEIFLEKPVYSAGRTNAGEDSPLDKEERITAIHRSMKKYLETEVFAPPQKTLVYIERDTPINQLRRGLLVALDLEAYNWETKSNPGLIRPTEGTVAKRLPSRMDIRRGAPLETPHILVLIDDEENILLPSLGERAKPKTENNIDAQANALYDTELMLGSGRVCGWKLDTEDDWEFLAGGLEKLAKNAMEKYGAPFLYAVGDGNHSLAAAKGIWEEYKAVNQDDSDIMNHSARCAHPTRWALVELVNLYDPALSFEPIHRLLFGTDITPVQQALATLPGYRCRKLNDVAELTALVQDVQCSLLRMGLVSREDFFLIEADHVPIAIDTLQPLLDKMIEEQKGRISMDYIHGSEELLRLAAKENSGEPKNNAVGILLPPFRKQGLFETIAKHGPLPRKSFSMGDACEKRFYLECRRLS
ncbi:MAG: DUF1015 domain-containing protein [Treponema sp.]|nr:DUF1015 domain-containing protein [Treponema sp.]